MNALSRSIRSLCTSTEGGSGGERRGGTAIILGLMICQAKSHPSLIPFFVFIGAGSVEASMYLLWLAVHNPDVSWNHKNNPEHWDKLASTQQYKFFTVNMDYSKLKKNQPDF
ncbi:cytochrome c oxidase subunit NDUFA4-like [Carcharodon carcharias]|uniref:cytochrome c oxidase subunit NDUFA4-like n=1 Tax=Carcharodon carcharias TaxID=13397 RepID=UPI001B7E3AFE|nr:cytochrome c oxidase subunit NDUFA4-like [Carcharodon carcharias]